MDLCVVVMNLVFLNCELASITSMERRYESLDMLKDAECDIM